MTSRHRGFGSQWRWGQDCTRGLGQWSARYIDVVEHDLLLTTTQLIPQVAQEQERMKLLEKICNNFQKVCQLMDDVCKDTSQHVEDICVRATHTLGSQHH